MTLKSGESLMRIRLIERIMCKMLIASKIVINKVKILRMKRMKKKRRKKTKKTKMKKRRRRKKKMVKKRKKMMMMADKL